MQPGGERFDGLNPRTLQVEVLHVGGDADAVRGAEDVGRLMCPGLMHGNLRR